MPTLHARVQGVHIVVDESTDLPEGTQLTLVMVDADDEMSPEERADLEAELERGRAVITGGQGIAREEWLARVRGGAGARSKAMVAGAPRQDS